MFMSYFNVYISTSYRVTCSNIQYLYSAARPCTQTNGMEDPQIIPDDNITTPPGSTGSVRPGDDNPLTIPPEEPNKEVTVDLTSDDYPEAPELGDFTPTNTDNVATFQIFIKPEGSTEFVPLDLDEDGVPDVCISNMIYNKVYQL